MQQLFILKKVDNVNHLIGKLIRNDDGDYEIESLLKTEGSEVFQIPVLAEQGKNSEKLMDWIMNFMLPIGNEEFTLALMKKFGIKEFELEPMELLKFYKPDGRNTISFCEFLPTDCVRHDNSVDFDFERDGAELDEEYGGYYGNECFEDYGDYDEGSDEFDDGIDDDEEEAPYVIPRGTLGDSIPVYPGNIPPEEPVTDAKAFAGKYERFEVESLRTIHNTLCALAKCPVTDLIAVGALADFTECLELSPNKLGGLSASALVKQYGHMIKENTAVPAYYSKLCIDLFGFLSHEFRKFAISQTISI